MPEYPSKSWLRNFFKKDSSAGLVLIMTSLAALLVANSPLSDFYHRIMGLDFTFGFPNLNITHSLHHWVNDGLMALFFLLVGLEIKREIKFGRLNSFRSAIFPVTAALSGAILPALIFWFMNKATPHINGWAIPMATDIAFVIGILAILAPRVPSWVKLFAITVAVVDDLIAILVIAFFYTEEINWIAMGVAGICVLVLLFFNYRNVNRLTLYLTVGFFLWWAVLGSGIHATIAGVILAFTIPLHREWELEEIKKSAKQSLELFRKAKDETLPETTTLAHHALEKTLRNMESPLKRLERKLHTPVYFIIMPLFAFVNAGIGFDGDVLNQAFLSSLTWGVILGLLGGKQAGILLAVLIFLKFFLTQRDNDRQTWMIFLGLSLLCGIGFTMSLFITNLSFTDPTSLEYAKLGVLVVSLVNALLGYFVLYRATLNPENKAIQ